jgi:hypothetical protein
MNHLTLILLFSIPLLFVFVFFVVVPRVRMERPASHRRHPTNAMRIIISICFTFVMCVQAYSETVTGDFITLEKLRFVGFATPEATVQSVKWMSMNSSFEAVQNTCLPEVRTNNQMSAKYFEESKEYTRRSFGGFQVLEKRTVGTNSVEMKILNVVLNRENSELKRATNFCIVTLASVGGEWKFAKDTRKYDAAWDKKKEGLVRPRKEGYGS